MALLEYLEPPTQDITYLMAVPSSMQGADYVLATGRQVLYLGGFKGDDRIVSPDDLAELVSEASCAIFIGAAVVLASPVKRTSLAG